nr:metallophosphoesterase [Haemophilus paracuniculus]
MLSILLFVFFSSFLTACLLKIGRHHSTLNRLLKIAYPFIFSGFIGLAIYNAYTPRVVSYSVQIDKPLTKPLKIGIASDLHLGKLVGKQQIDKLVNLFNQQQVDLILLAGDIMDDTTQGYLADNLQPNLSKLKAPLGVYVALGNHDYFVEPEKIRQELEKAGLTVLEDETVNINDQFYIIGRKDELVKNRQTSGQLLANLDQTKPIFLVEHRPSQIEQNSQLPIDLAAMGHTHKGQIFPANFITKLVHFMDYGSQKVGNGNYIVTSGFGFWGVPFRLGSQSEVVVVEVTGKQ